MRREAGAPMLATEPSAVARRSAPGLTLWSYTDASPGRHELHPLHGPEIPGVVRPRQSGARRRTIRRRRAVALALVVTLIGVAAIASSQLGGGAAGSASRRARRGVLAARAQRSPGASVRGHISAHAAEGLRPGSDPSVLPGPVLIADSDNNRLLEVGARCLSSGKASSALCSANRSHFPLNREDPRVRGLPRVASIRDRAVSNRDNANRLLGLGELVDDSVRTDAERAQAFQAPA